MRNGGQGMGSYKHRRSKDWKRKRKNSSTEQWIDVSFLSVKHEGHIGIGSPDGTSGPSFGAVEMIRERRFFRLADSTRFALVCVTRAIKTAERTARK